eukprot:18362-Heterococcus_DN1.PRE.2
MTRNASLSVNIRKLARQKAMMQNIPGEPSNHRYSIAIALEWHRLSARSTIGPNGFSHLARGAELLE